MSCPTCDHTMEGLSCNDPHGRSHFLCPRCGTHKEVSGACRADGGFVTVHVPKLVGFLREFHRMISDDSAGRALRSFARTSGITEAIFKPEDRK